MILSGVDSRNIRAARAFLLSRMDFEVRILDIPHIPEKELDGLIRYRLRSLYPGNPRETAFDYRVERGGRRRQAVVFISRLATVEKSRSSAHGLPLVLPYSIVQKIGKANRDCRIWFCLPDWAELSLFRAGLLVSSTVHSTDNGVPFDLHQAAEEIPQKARGFPLIVVAPAADLPRVEAAAKARGTGGVRALAFEDLAVEHRKVDGLFGAPRRPLLVFPPAVRIAALATIVCLLALQVLFKQVRKMETENGVLKKTHSLLESQSLGALALRKSVDDLSASLSRITERKPQDTYQFLSELADVLRNDAQVRSLEIDGDTFRIEAKGLNPLQLMEGFRDNPRFGAVRLSQVVPEPRSVKERFSISGVFRAR